MSANFPPHTAILTHKVRKKLRTRREIKKVENRTCKEKYRKTRSLQTEGGLRKTFSCLFAAAATAVRSLVSFRAFRKQGRKKKKKIYVQKFFSPVSNSVEFSSSAALLRFCITFGVISCQISFKVQVFAVPTTKLVCNLT